MYTISAKVEIDLLVIAKGMPNSEAEQNLIQMIEKMNVYRKHSTEDLWFICEIPKVVELESKVDDPILQKLDRAIGEIVKNLRKRIT